MSLLIQCDMCHKIIYPDKHDRPFAIVVDIFKPGTKELSEKFTIEQDLCRECAMKVERAKDIISVSREVVPE